jgi:hypothetical protein
LSIFFASAGYRITRNQLGARRQLAIGPRMVFSAAAAGAEFEARLHILVQKGMEIA